MNAPFLLLALAACAGAQVSGTVRDAVTRQPVEGVKVTVAVPANRTAMSNAEGTFVLDGIEPGKYRVPYSRQGYDAGAATVEVQADAGRQDPASGT